MRIVFLDFDGVLNSTEYLNKDPRAQIVVVSGIEGLLSPEMVGRLNRITDATGAKIVTTTAWRYHLDQDDLVEVLEKAGVTAPVIDRTPLLFEETRRTEIQEWLDMHPEVTSFVILEDAHRMGNLKRFTVYTDEAIGLLDEHVDQAISILES